MKPNPTVLSQMTRTTVPGEMTSSVLKIATEARKLTLGPFSPSFNVNQIIFDSLVKFLPDDVHLKVTIET